MSMNKKIRNGFSMIELLFVMVIMAALMAVAIPNLSAGSLSEKITSMKSDAKGAMTSMQTIFTLNDNSAPTGTLPKTIAAGDPAWNGVQFGVTKGNSVTIDTSTCGDTSYTISVADATDPQLTPNTIDFDSCTDTAIRTTKN